MTTRFKVWLVSNANGLASIATTLVVVAIVLAIPFLAFGSPFAGWHCGADDTCPRACDGRNLGNWTGKTNGCWCVCENGSELHHGWENAGCPPENISRRAYDVNMLIAIPMVIILALIMLGIIALLNLECGQ